MAAVANHSSSVECPICEEIAQEFDVVFLVRICENNHKICHNCIFGLKVDCCPFCQEEMIPIDYDKYTCVCGMHARNNCAYRPIPYYPEIIRPTYPQITPDMPAAESAAIKRRKRNDKQKRRRIIKRYEEQYMLYKESIKDWKRINWRTPHRHLQFIADCYKFCQRLLDNNICSDEQFEIIRQYVETPSTTLDEAIDYLKTTYVTAYKNILYFTPDQSKQLVKRKWPTNNYKWHNILVFMCLEFYELSADDFTCGICYFGRVDQFSMKNYVRAVVDRGFNIADKPNFF